MAGSSAASVLHLVAPLASGDHLWGKERVVQRLMDEQRSSGSITPYLMTFEPCYLAELAAEDGIVTEVISTNRRRNPFADVASVRRMLERYHIDVIHSHGYKANITARALRVMGCAHPVRLVSTCHGWVESTFRLRLYNAVDRWSAGLSDVTTVPDPAMLRRYSHRAFTCHIPNGIPETEAGDEEPLPEIRAGAAFVAGTLGRVSVEKGIPEFLHAAAASSDRDIDFVVAGVGDLTERVAGAGTNVRYVGYIRQPHRYMSQLDAYVQSSRSEGLSLALLEAMRAGKAIVATDVGATRDAIVDGQDGILVRPERPDALLAAILRLKNDPALAAFLGANARRRFESDFLLNRQHQRYLELYTSPLPQPAHAAREVHVLVHRT